ncbi:MAG TPA: hypothetical protein VF142_02760 [Longimicrobium sp.]
MATLRARSTVSAALADSGWAEIRRAFPTLTLGKTVDPTGVLAPGTDLTYALQFANAGDYEATQVQVTDQVPAEVLVKLNSATQALPGGLTATVQYSADPADTPPERGHDVDLRPRRDRLRGGRRAAGLRRLHPPG